ncbi:MULTISPECIES: MFS transporter [Streptomyces]|uniref:Major facilitator transporter n=1 Tax=Streptomyces viridochromogenes TaxID=1938 RepID=A0A0L8L7P7_STRVR|nr:MULTISPECIES: MFS transporter [Streptomyces]KOG34130.1 major facilitator transporter [Streptomyces viridochromogenes]
MLSVLRNRTYRRLFGAQVVALSGTGLATVALSLLAYDLAGADAAAVLGTALAIKMAAYVGLAPVVSALADRVPRRALLVAMDLARAAVALSLPFVTRVWQVYVLILLLQAASAAFTPAFQATIPQVLPDEREYTEALSLSRLAYDLESLVSPVLAAALLTVVPYAWLFTGTAAGFLASALLVHTTALPEPPEPAPPGDARVRGGRVRGGRARRAYGKVAFGTRLLLATPRLRALLALDLAVAAAGAVVLVGTVLLVRDTLGRAAGDVPLALGAYGAGSMAVALLLPRVLGRAEDRAVMVRAAFVLPGALGMLAVGLAVPSGVWSWPALLVLWAVVGAAGSAVLTPGGRVVRRSAGSGDLPAAFAARFSLSHACWLVTYPLAGWLAVRSGPAVAAAVLAAVALLGAVGAARLWPRTDPVELPHVHPELPAGHPHLAGAARPHAHDFHIDALHRHWPKAGAPAAPGASAPAPSASGSRASGPPGPGQSSGRPASGRSWSGQRVRRISRPSRTTSRP